MKKILIVLIGILILIPFSTFSQEVIDEETNHSDDPSGNIRYGIYEDTLMIQNYHEYIIEDSALGNITHSDLYEWFINYSSFTEISNFYPSKDLGFEFDLCQEDNICVTPTNKEIIYTEDNITIYSDQIEYFLSTDSTMLDIKIKYQNRGIAIGGIPQQKFTFKNIKSEAIRTSDFDVRRNSLSANDYSNLSYKDFVFYDTPNKNVSYVFDFSFNSNPFLMELSRDNLVLTFDVDKAKTPLVFRWKDAATAYMNPGTCTGWTNCGNAAADGGGYSSTTTNNAHDKQRNYGFTIPDGSTLTGIEVQIDAWYAGLITNPAVVLQLSKDSCASLIGNSKTSAITTSETTYTAGSSSDMWGIGGLVDADDINDVNFCVDVKASGRTPLLTPEWRNDWIRVRIHYTPSGVEGLAMTLQEPLNLSTQDNGNVSFHCNASSDTDIDNITLWHDFSGTFSPNTTDHTTILSIFNSSSSDSRLKYHDKDMVLGFNFDEGTGAFVNDLSGNGNYGSFIDNMSNANWVDGKRYTGVIFGNLTASQQITVADSDSLDSMSENWTMALWVNYEHTPNNYDKLMVRGLDWRLSIMADGDLDFSNGSDAKLTSTFLTPKNTWTHVTVKNNATNIYFYKNGQFIESGTKSLVLKTTSSQNLSIGAYTTGTFDFNGSIDGIALFNRSLTDVEITALYGSGNTITARSIASEDRINFTDIPDGTYTWNCEVCNLTQCTYDTGNFTFTIDTACNIPLINNDWDITSNCTKIDTEIDLGTGKLIINDGGSLTLFNSNITYSKRRIIPETIPRPRLMLNSPLGLYQNG